MSHPGGAIALIALAGGTIPTIALIALAGGAIPTIALIALAGGTIPTIALAGGSHTEQPGGKSARTRNETHCEKSKINDSITLIIRHGGRKIRVLLHKCRKEMR
jgi:hypothetical protein